MRVKLGIYTTTDIWKVSQNCTIWKNFQISRVEEILNRSRFHTITHCTAVQIKN